MRTLRKLVITLAAGAGSLALAVPAWADPGNPSTTTETSAESASAQASLVSAEDTRLDQVRAVSAVAAMKGQAWTKPYRLDTGDGYTLVLTQRREVYTVADLLTLAPQTFVRQTDGSYLLTENIYLNSGAKLRLSNPGGLTLRMASTTNGYVSIVSFGGEISITGTPQAETVITSWDKRTSQPDTRVDDGRAYIRAIGGSFTMTYAQVSDLGYWSGRTAGISLTGTDRPDTGDVDGPSHLTKAERHAAKTERLSGDSQDDEAPSAGDITAQPSGALTSPDTRFEVPGMSYVSGSITHSTIDGDAFGLFVSSATGITVTDTNLLNNLEDGLVLHRFASSAEINRVVSSHNGGDGFILSRAAQQVRVSGSTAEGNGGNGFTVDGLPLAVGPSASGEFVGSYGNNSVANCVVKNNGHYGVEVIGGLNVAVQNNTVEGSDMGIVARQGTVSVAINGNQVTGQKRQGIAIRDGVTKAVITGNIITNADNAIYVRDSTAEIRGNTVIGATNHGISMVGLTSGTLVSYNVVAGVGPSALDTSRSSGTVDMEQNQLTAWHDTSSFWVKFRHYASPMTLLWVGILGLIIGSAALGVRRREPGVGSPYANSRTLASLTAGVSE